MKRILVFLLVAALGLIAAPIAASPPALGEVMLATTAVQAETVNLSLSAIQLNDEVLPIPIDAVATLGQMNIRSRGTAPRGPRQPRAPSNTGSGSPPGGGPPPGNTNANTGGPPPAEEPTGDRVVKAGKTRRFECTTPCYWNGTRWHDATELHKERGDVIEFHGPTEIPADFQFSNWQES